MAASVPDAEASARPDPTAGGRSPLHATTRADTWRALNELRSQGRVRSIGVCNHSPRQIAKLSPAPAVVQVEHHPLLQRSEILQYCREHGIIVTAYSPLGSPDNVRARKESDPSLLGNQRIAAIGARFFALTADCASLSRSSSFSSMQRSIAISIVTFCVVFVCSPDISTGFGNKRRSVLSPLPCGRPRP